MTTNQTSSRNKRLIFASVFAVFCCVALILVRASSPNVSLEAESGTKSGNIQPITNDSTASGNNAVSFPGTTPDPATYYVIGSGDIGGTDGGGSFTGDQIKNLSPAANAVIALGDLAYDNGTATEFTNNYNPYWGAFKNKTYPAPGNHEYNTSGAAPYYAYFSATANSISGNTVSGRADRGYYAWNVGNKWRFYSLNSEANIAEANTWLAGDLSANKASRPCQIAYWHKPPFTSSSTHPEDGIATISTYFTTLYNNKAEVVLAAHNHHYERFYPQKPDTVRDDTNGILSIVVGTGGRTNFYGFTSPAAANSAVKNSNTRGNLLMSLKDDLTYRLDFLPVAGGTFTDTVSGTCKL